jgi:hypothetical protein
MSYVDEIASLEEHFLIPCAIALLYPKGGVFSTLVLFVLDIDRPMGLLATYNIER